MAWYDAIGDAIGGVAEGIYDIGANLFGGLTGDSDIGKTNYQVPYYQVDPGFYANPSAAEQYILPPEMQAYEQQQRELLPRIEEQKAQYAAYAEQQFQEYMNSLSPTDQEKYRISARRDPNFEQTFKQQFIRSVYNDPERRAEMFSAVGQPIDTEPLQGRSTRDRLIDQAFGVGQDTSATQGFLDAFNYQGGYDPIYEAYKKSGQYEAPTMDYEQQFYGTGMNAAPIESDLSDIYRGYGGQSREEQLASLGLLGAAARGEAPSQAEIQMKMGLEQASREQMAAARSARGGIGAQMLAQRNAANQGALMQQAGINQQAALRAQEMAQARQGYMTGATGIRGQDITGQQIAQNREIQDALLRQEAQRITVQNAQEAGMLGEQQRWKTDMANIDAKLKTMGYNIQDRANMIGAYMDKLGIDQRQKAMYLDAFLKSRGYDINERQTAMANVIGIDTRTMAGNQAFAGAQQSGEQFRQGTNVGIAQGNAAAGAQNFGTSLNFVGALGSSAATMGGSGAASNAGGWTPNYGSTPSFYGGSSPQPVQPVGSSFGDNILDPWENT